MERSFWITFFLLSYSACATLFLLDSTMVKHDYQWIFRTIGLIMLGFLFCLAPYYPFLRDHFLDGPAIEQRFAKFCNLVGPVVSIGLIFALDGRKGDAVGPYLYWILLSALFCSFFAIVLLRPVATDFGSFYPLCAILINFSVKEYHKQSWQTYLAVGSCVFMMILRAIFESVAVCTTATARKKAERADAASTAAAVPAAPTSAVTSSTHDA